MNAAVVDIEAPAMYGKNPGAIANRVKGTAGAKTEIKKVRAVLVAWSDRLPVASCFVSASALSPYCILAPPLSSVTLAPRPSSPTRFAL